MKFKLDENLPAAAVRVLADAGHDVSTALQERLGGKPDSRVAETCKLERRALITLDNDFGNIQAYPPAEYSGLVVLRLAQQDKSNILSMLTRLIERFEREPLSGRLWVVEAHRVRIRPGDD
jgi:predicted nuclease of predicted toxin-antitoxin system